jgi:hypothetical protein
MHAIARAVSEELIVIGVAARKDRGSWPGKSDSEAAE